MRGRGWYWLLILAGMAWPLTATAVRAFSRPWTWTLDQCLALLFAATILFMAILWGTLWMRLGTTGVKARWSDMLQASPDPPSKRFFAISVVVWIAIALALAFAFNLSHG